MSNDALRVDRWLWCARFFKSRNGAAEAVKSGHVRLNGQRVKPSREVRVGDLLSISRGTLDFELRVAGIPMRRGPASEAAGCYDETPESIAAREAKRSARSGPLADLGLPPTTGRPDKRTRRLIRRVRDPLNSD